MALGEPGVGREEKQLACEAALKSRTFARSEQLQGFLRYICEMELAGRGAEISEYSIATVALNRKSDYAPGEDSSVRSRAHALRRKLQEYYEAEPQEGEWRIELPKGSYRPLFVSRNQLLPEVRQAAIETPLPKRQGVSRVRPFLLGVATATALAAILLALLGSRLRPDAIDAVVREAWGPTVAAGGDVLIVVGCPPLARFTRNSKSAPPKTAPLPAPAELLDWYQDQNLEHRGVPLFLFPTRNYPVFADALATAAVTSLLTTSGTGFQATPEPFVQLMAIHERGLVVIGAPAYTGLAARMLKVMPYSIRFDEGMSDEVITDGRSVFAPTRAVANRFSTVYGLITVLPSQPGRSRPERTLIFSGITGSPGAQAAVQFFTSPAAMRDLRARFRKEGYAQWPAAYQVVVRCGVDREEAINSVYETHRILATPPVIE